jgi:vacuolar-type H+-ATPase subunit H
VNEIVNQVFEAEDQARNLLEKTRSEILTLQKNTDKEIEEINIRTREQSTSTIKDIIEEARKQVEETRNKTLSEAEQEDEAFFLQKKDKIAGVIDKIVDYICTPEYLRDE